MTRGLMVFGGSGFIARSLYDEIGGVSDFDGTIYSVSRGRRLGSALPISVQEIFADVTLGHTLERIPSNVNVSRVIYLADSSTVNIMAEGDRYRSALKGIRNVVNFCKMRGITDLTYVSTGAVYIASPHLKTEASRILSANSGTSYATAKVIAEKILGEIRDSSDLNIKIARCFSFVGENMPNSHFAVMNFLWNARRGEDICVEGSGLEERSYLHQRELARAILKLCFHNQSITVNVGSDRSIKILDLANLIAQMFGRKVRKSVFTGEIDRNCYVPNVDSYKHLFGEIELYTLEQRLQMTYDALSEVTSA